LLKAQMHPEILFASLEKIQLLAQRNETDKASILLLKLADILSYILYECDKAFVPLEKEIKIIKDYLVLQKTNMGNRLEMDIAVKGEPGNKMIAPLLLFTLIENCFAYIDNTNLDQNWINLEFQVEDTELTLKMIHGKTEDSSARPGGVGELASVIRNLDFYYPGNYELNRTIEPEIRMIYLKIITGGHMSKRNNIQNISEQITYATA
ncbi:MAG TPA: histidine kinase, partial [Chitinophagaceae bacterium]|nr:histidine kinase [Chitinophagaceae bacterium]